MFKLEPIKTWLEARPEQVAYIATSVNRPVVVPPGRAPEPAQAYVCVLRTAQGYEFYIYLHLITSNLGLLYRWDLGAMPKEKVPQVQQAAAEFTESMGFMMTDLRWRELTPEQKLETFNNLPVFFQDLSRFKEQTEEEILEIEPAKEEIVVEPIEEPVETITEGDFVIHEEGYTESKPEREMVFDEIPEIPPPEEAPEKKPAREMSEEDLLLESLEVKEESVSTSASSVPQPAPEIMIEIEEEKKEGAGEAPAYGVVSAPPQEELAWEKDLAEAEQKGAELLAGSEGSVGIEREPVANGEPVSESGVEEIPLETVRQPAPKPSSSTIEAKPVPGRVEPPQETAPISSPRAEPVSEPREASLGALEMKPEKAQVSPRIEPGKKPSKEGQISDEDLRLAIKFLAML